MQLHDLFEGNEQAYNWHSEPEQRSMDATRQARLYREREPEGSEAIDARLRAQNDQLAQYNQSGQFWLKQKDTQEHISDAMIGKAAANAAAVELLKQRPELKGNLVITAYGPGESQGVTEGEKSPMAKDAQRADRIRSLKNLIAIAQEQGRQLRVQELELELKKLQGVTEMDKSSPQPGRDGRVSHSTYGSRDKGGSKGTERAAQPITTKKAAQHALDILKKQGVAEGLSGTQKKIEDTILKLEQRLKFAKTPEQWDNIKNRIERLQAGLDRSKQGVAEGELATYLVSVMDSATGEHWRIEVKVTSPEMAKQRAEAMGYKVLGVKEKSGMAEGAGNIGRAIKSLYQKIYAAGDDEIEYFYNASPIFAQYWDEYEGDLDSIIAEVDPEELAVIKAELESYAQDANLAEAPGAETLSHNQSTVSKNLNSLDLDESHNPYGYEVGQTVKLHNGSQGRVIDIFDDSIEVLLPGGRTVTVDFRDAEVLGEQNNAPPFIDNMMNQYAASIGQPFKREPGVDAKGRTQAQWIKLVKTKFPTAKIQQTKMIDGPVTAILDDGRKLSWKKVEQAVSEAYDPAQAAKYIAAATKAAKIVFNHARFWNRDFRSELENQYGFDPDSPGKEMTEVKGKELIKWLESKGCKLSYDPRSPIDFSLSMPDQAEPYEFNVLEQNLIEDNGQAAKFDPKTGLPTSAQLREFGGDATQFSTPTQSTPTTEQPPRRGYSIILTGKPGRDWMATYAWQALEKVLPRDYPGQSTTQTDNPAQRKVAEVANRGSAVVKTGITSEDIAETLVAKLAANRVPAEFWRITSEDLDEGDISQLEKDVAAAPVAPIANMEADEKIGGRYDPDDFDAMVSRLKKLAGAGPMKTVWDPQKRVYKNVPTAVQPAQQPKK